MENPDVVPLPAVGVKSESRRMDTGEGFEETPNRELMVPGLQSSDKRDLDGT